MAQAYRQILASLAADGHLKFSIWHWH